MKYTQNEKILQLTEQTLIIGVDVASETQYARAFDYRGIEIGKIIRFDNNAEGFTRFSMGKRDSGQTQEERCNGRYGANGTLLV